MIHLGICQTVLRHRLLLRLDGIAIFHGSVSYIRCHRLYDLNSDRSYILRESHQSFSYSPSMRSESSRPSVATKGLNVYSKLASRR